VSEWELHDEVSPDIVRQNMALSLLGQDAFLRRLGMVCHRELEAILAHARSTVPFYQSWLHTSSQLTLDDFPLIDRSIMQDRRDAFISDLYREQCKPFFTFTDGTFNKPLKVSFDLASFYEFSYFSFARIFRTRLHVLKWLQPEVPCIYLLTHVSDQQRTTALIPSLGGTLLRRLPMYRNDADDRDTVLCLRKGNVPVLYGRPHVLLRLADLDAQEPPTEERIRPYSLLVMGENLYDSDRTSLIDWFGCEIINAYTASEAGLIAVDCQAGHGFHVQTERIIAEILDSNGCVVSDGMGELVITNLMNWCQPFLRYRLGDHVTLRHGQCECGFRGPTITYTSGRDEESVYVVGKGTVPSAELERVLTRPEVRQYEVAQEQNGFLTVRWISVPNTDRQAQVVH
jgi:hypothetical protein